MPTYPDSTPMASRPPLGERATARTTVFAPNGAPFFRPSVISRTPFPSVPIINRVPERVQARVSTAAPWLLKLYLVVPSVIHTRTLSSRPPEPISVPSRLHATASTPSLCPVNVSVELWLPGSQSRAVRSCEPDTSWDPSGDQERLATVAL